MLVLEDKLNNELMSQRGIGIELGYAVGREAGIKEGIEVAICELLNSELLPSNTIMDLFSLDRDEINRLISIIKTPRWQISHHFNKIHS